MALLLFLLPIILIIVMIIIGFYGLVKLFSEFNKQRLSFLQRLIYLICAVGTGVLISLLVRELPKDYMGHPFFGPYGMFAIIIAVHLIGFYSVYKISIVKNSTILLLFSRSILAGTLTSPGYILSVIILKSGNADNGAGILLILIVLIFLYLLNIGSSNNNSSPPEKNSGKLEKQ